MRFPTLYVITITLHISTFTLRSLESQQGATVKYVATSGLRGERRSTDAARSA